MWGVRRLLIICLVAYFSVFHSFATLGSVIALLLFVFVAMPLIYRNSRYIHRSLIFLPWVQLPNNIDLSKPEQLGLDGTLHVRIRSAENVEVGLWHILPKSLIAPSKGRDREWFEATLSHGYPIVVYMHGNKSSRARNHRMEMYHVLRTMNFHVFTFDYRGYGDSSKVEITKTGVIEDSKAVLSYVRSLATAHSQRPPIIVWGHSLGTAVSSATLAELSSQSVDHVQFPDALVLESPFNNITEEICSHPMSLIWRRLPYFAHCFTSRLAEYDVNFETDGCMNQLRHLPLLILHAEDDLTVPHKLGVKLYECAKLVRDQPGSADVEMVSFPASEGLGHVSIYSVPGLPKIIRNFLSSAQIDVSSIAN